MLQTSIDLIILRFSQGFIPRHLTAIKIHHMTIKMKHAVGHITGLQSKQQGT